MLRFECELPRHTFSISVSMKIDSGSIYTLFGPSGAGKSSILNVMAGFEQGSEKAFLSVDERVLLDVGNGKSRNVPAYKRGIVLVEQGASLFPHLSVEENIRYGIGSTGMDPFIRDWIERFQLSSYLSRKPNQLSGGLIQRAVLVRAAAARPRVLLLDEPLSALDSELSRTLMDALLEFRENLGTTIIMVTHQLSQAQRISDSIGVISKGRILQEGTPHALMSSPDSFEVARLLGFTHRLKDGHGREFALHPNQVLVGKHPDLGVVITGTVHRKFPRDGFQRVVILVDDSDDIIEVDLPLFQDPAMNEEFSVTLPNPIYVE